jgi:DNA replication protein DnaC
MYELAEPGFCSDHCKLSDWLHWHPLPSGIDTSIWEHVDRVQQVFLIAEWLIQREELELPAGLLLHGQISGTGKTAVGTHAFLEVVKFWWAGKKAEKESVADGDGPTGLYYNTARLRQEFLKSMTDHEAKAKWLAELCEARVLFLDDIDKLHVTPTLIELLFSVLDVRLPDEWKSTILTTNASGNALQEHWGPVYGPPLVRRLRDFSLMVNFD